MAVLLLYNPDMSTSDYMKTNPMQQDKLLPTGINLINFERYLLITKGETQSVINCFCSTYPRKLKNATNMTVKTRPLYFNNRTTPVVRVFDGNHTGYGKVHCEHITPE